MSTYLLIFYIILAIIVIRYKYLLIKGIFFEPMIINKQVYFHDIHTENRIINSDTLPKAYLGTNFSFNFCIFLKNTSENECQDSSSVNNVSIFDIKNKSNHFILELNRHDSSLNLKIKNDKYKDGDGDNTDIGLDLISSISSSDKNKNEIYHTIVHNLPNQKWMNISLNIENKYIDVYVNGKLYNSFYCFHNIEFITPGKITFYNNNGFYGYISKFRYFNKTIDHKRVSNLYKGNVKNSGQYNILWWTY